MGGVVVPIPDDPGYLKFRKLPFYPRPNVFSRAGIELQFSLKSSPDRHSFEPFGGRYARGIVV